LKDKENTYTNNKNKEEEFNTRDLDQETPQLSAVQKKGQKTTTISDVLKRFKA